MAKRFLIFCEVCGYKQIVNDTPKDVEGLVPFKTAAVPAGVPKLVNGKVVTRPSIETMPKYKCPKCGRVVTSKRLPKPLHEPAPPPPEKIDPFDARDENDG
jgi:DNA-directed RNA polymerase subunit RPC12/RpoP